jgi:hypothetical protein
VYKRQIPRNTSIRIFGGLRLLEIRNSSKSHQKLSHLLMFFLADLDKNYRKLRLFLRMTTLAVQILIERLIILDFDLEVQSGRDSEFVDCELEQKTVGAIQRHILE